MVTGIGVLLNSLWILGLSGVLATISYMDWLRKERSWSWRIITQTAAFLFPFSLSMLITCIGIGASGWYGTPSQPFWQTLLWLVLAVLFAMQSVAYYKVGHQKGWYSSLDKEV